MDKFGKVWSECVNRTYCLGVAKSFLLSLKLTSYVQNLKTQ